ncbi:hypothetical protein J4413_02620 [Candidatus Woesearchaeota archaeon]|nr:hypothetical protein [Candidatus Woesearchaeota archaeon]
MSNKKAQAAMEFLMTYGWAIMIVLIGIGALFFLGVFNPSTPSVCNIASPFICQDVSIKDVGGQRFIQLKVAATNIDTAKISNIKINSITCPNTGAVSLGITVDSTDNADPTGADISKSRSTPVTVTCGFADALIAGTKVSGSYDISWTKQFGVSHLTSGTFSGTVEAG